MNERVTIYATGEFMGAVQKIEAMLKDFGQRQYAQYPLAPFVTYTPKGKRKTYTICKGYEPYILILAGWNNPEPDDWLVPTNDGNKMSRYASFDKRYEQDFNRLINPLIANKQVTVIADYRHNKHEAYSE